MKLKYLYYLYLIIIFIQFINLECFVSLGASTSSSAGEVTNLIDIENLNNNKIINNDFIIAGSFSFQTGYSKSNPNGPISGAIRSITGTNFKVNLLNTSSPETSNSPFYTYIYSITFNKPFNKQARAIISSNSLHVSLLSSNEKGLTVQYQVYNEIPQHPEIRIYFIAGEIT